MIDFHRFFAKIPNYVRRFGLIQGLRLLYQIEQNLDNKSTQIRQYNVPGFKSPIYLRDTISDHAIFWQCLVENQYDFKSFPQAERLLKNYNQICSRNCTPLIIDCGGNIGLASIWLATTLPDVRIVVIEPEQGNFNLLLKNIQPFGDRIKALQGGIWHQSGYLTITNSDAGSAAFRVTQAVQPVAGSIRAYTIPEICEMEGGTTPFIVKIDIEGAQKYLFRHNTSWVESSHLIMLELDDWLLPWQGTSRPFFSVLSSYPFDYLMRGEVIFCFRDFEVDCSSC